MIVKMKEVFLFTLSTSTENTVQELGKLGVVEVREINTSNEEQIERLREKTTAAEIALSSLDSYPGNVIPEKNGGYQNNGNNRKKYKSSDPVKIVERVLISDNYLKWCKKTLEALEQQLKWYETWGEDFKLEDFQYLQAKGIYIHLYLVEKPMLNFLPKNKTIVTFDEKESKIPVAFFSRSGSDKLDLREVELPDFSRQEIQKKISRKKRQIKEVEFFLEDQAENIELLRDYHRNLTDQLNARKVMAGMGNIEGRIKYLRGFIPHNAVNLFKKRASENAWGYQISTPEHPEKVPVLIKNPKWVTIINPVIKFIDIVPGYDEVDVSVFFLIAFALFFAILVGDAGYGAVFLIMAILFGKKLTSQLSALIYTLSCTTILWGILSGTYFGSEQIAAIPFFNKLIVPEIASFGVDNVSFMMHFSFLIGALHLTTAHFIRLFQFKNSIRALSELGWVILVWGLFFVVEKMVLAKELPAWNRWLFFSGAALIILFSQEHKSFISSIFTSLANLPLSLISGFSDIVSYVRLFAVSMASVTVASSFNSMILSDAIDLSLFEILVAAVALALGHGLNITLALMAVMVHGIRLNMLEFAGHLGVQFSGEAYQPFKLNGTNDLLTDSN